MSDAKSCHQLVDSPKTLLSFFVESGVCSDAIANGVLAIANDALVIVYFSSVLIMSGLNSKLIVLCLGPIWAKLSFSYIIVSLFCY